MTTNTPDKFDEEKYLERVLVNPLDVEAELCKNPSWMAYYGTQATRWQAIADLLKLQRDVRRGEVYKEMEENGEKTTGVRVDAYQDTDPQYVKFAKDYIRAKEQADHFTKAAVNLASKQFVLTGINNRNIAERDHSRGVSYQGEVEGDMASKKQAILDKYR